MLVISCVIWSLFSVADSTKPGQPTFTAASTGIEVQIDRDKAGAAGFTSNEIVKAVETFARSHRTFKLSEMQALQLRNRAGKSFQLKDFASIDVTFGGTNMSETDKRGRVEEPGIRQLQQEVNQLREQLERIQRRLKELEAPAKGAPSCR